jgi:hypothetical protein
VTVTALDIDYPLPTTEHVLTLCPALDPTPDTPDAVAELVRLADEQRGRLLSILPTVIEWVRVDEVAGELASHTARQLATIVIAAGTAGLATVHPDPQAELFDAFMVGAAYGRVDQLANAMSLRPFAVDLDAVANLTEIGDRS